MGRPGFVRRFGASAGVAALIGGAVLGGLVGGSAAAAAGTVSGPPAYDHVVQVVFENHEQSQIIGASNAPYLSGLAAQAANLTQSFAIEHPSEPNYLDLYSGSNQGVTDDSCPHTFSTDNVGHQLIAAGKTFVGYSEDLPSAGSATCGSGDYARKHNPWSYFSDLDQTSVNQPYTAFPTDFTKLPTLSWVIPNLCNDMHSCAVSVGDTWAKAHLDTYAQWAKTHNSLLIVTFDEDDSAGTNQIATLLVGAHVTPGNYADHVNHYTMLRTIEDMYGLPALGGAVNRSAITDVFNAGGGEPKPSGTYTIGRSGTNQVIDDPGGSATDGKQMILWSRNGGANQNWTATVNPDGTYTFRNKASGRCLDDSGSSTAAGNPIIQWTCHGSANQDWNLIAAGGGYQLINKAGRLAATPTGTTDGSTLSQQATTQTWTLTEAS